jgi:GntR family transcriptional regulator, arabinose operon transcriptional repressor
MGSIDKQSAVPIYQQLASTIRKQILQGIFRQGDKLPSEFELVRQYQISRSSVRQAIDLLVRDGLVEKHHGKGNFIHKWRDGRDEKGIIGLLLPDERFSLFMDVLNGAEASARDRGYSLIVSYTGVNDKTEREVIQHLRSQNVAGFVIFPRNFITYDEAIWGLYEVGFPFVLIDRYFPELPSNFVGIDNFTAAYRVVEYLIERGHCAIGFATSPDTNTSSIRERFQGYQAALHDHDIEFKASWLCESSTVYSSPVFTEQEEVREMDFFRNFFKRKELPTAIFAINDHTAYLVYHAAKSEGIQVPQNLSLVGFDNDDFSRIIEVPLTTVHQPFREVGARAASLLIDQLRGVGLGLERIFLPTHLVIRQSCGEKLEKMTFG